MLGLRARHRGIVELSARVVRFVAVIQNSVRLLYLLTYFDQVGRSLREASSSSGFGASAQDPHGPPGGGPTELPIETHTMGMVDEKLRDERIAKVRSSLCAIL